MASLNPPFAPKRHKTLKQHGITRVDPWFWLRDQNDPATIEYLKAENAYTKAIMKPTEGLQQALYAEMRARIKEDDASVPEQEGSYFYYHRHEKGAQYPVYCRKHQTLTADEEVILNVNALAAGQSYFRLGICENSPDHRYLAYSVDLDGSEAFTIHVKDLTTGELLAEQIASTYYSLEWASDSETFFYTVLDEHHRPLRVYRHRLGTEPVQDVLIYEEEDPRFFVSLARSESGRFIYICCEGNNMSEWYYLDRRSPTADLVMIEPRRTEHEYDVTDHGEHFYIRTNLDKAQDFKVAKVEIHSPGAEHWVDFIPHRDGTLVTDLVAFKDYLVVTETANALPRIQIITLASGETEYLEFAEPAYHLRVIEGREFDTTTLRFAYSSLTTPEQIYDHDMTSGNRVLRKQEPVLGGFDSSKYESRRIFANGCDGTDIPISLGYRKGTALDGTAPLVLYGYGSYGHSMAASFNRLRLSYLDRGFVYAIAHVRGGMELGYRWYEDGKLLRKRNTFDDYIASAECLIENNFTSEGQILAVGGSAGGMLVGAVANMRPELFKAIIAHVPFVDVANTMLDDTLPLTTAEYNEWGNPHDKQAFEYILSYSPYDNLKPQPYPHMLIVCGLNDPRVTYWEPAKWTAKLRDMKTDDNVLLLKTHMDSGHAGASGRFDYLKEKALDVAFALKVFDKR
ncbi:MAG: S9 family peptidase [Acidiferrobacterales bacterium]